MFGSSFGNLFKITTFGESHGEALGVVIDGCPAGLALCEDDVQVFLDRRKPGRSRYSTPRKEEDRIRILSGVFEGRTTGTPIAMTVFNTNQRSGDYKEIAEFYRPGHADQTYDAKFGFRDYRGGGRSSGRETLGRVAAGAVAAKLLNRLGISLCTYTLSIGPVTADRERFDLSFINQNPLYMPDSQAAAKAAEYLEECMASRDSSGGVIECVVHNMPAGVGEPVFEKLDANLSKAVFSIGAVKAVEIGDGMAAAKATGLSNNDAYQGDGQGHIHKVTNHAGGILGGISDGSDIVLRAVLKPTPSISSPQQTVNKNGETMTVNVKGRHDPVVVPRAVVVVESMAALTLTDMLLGSMMSRMDRIEEFFRMG